MEPQYWFWVPNYLVLKHGDLVCQACLTDWEIIDALEDGPQYFTPPMMVRNGYAFVVEISEGYRELPVRRLIALGFAVTRKAGSTSLWLKIDDGV
jgi:hypothetical protein